MLSGSQNLALKAVVEESRRPHHIQATRVSKLLLVAHVAFCFILDDFSKKNLYIISSFLSFFSYQI
jgi:hypothetical protein